MHAKLSAGTKQAKPNNLIKNITLNPIPISKVIIIAILNVLLTLLILNVNIPEINISMILIISNPGNKMANPLKIKSFNKITLFIHRVSIRLIKNNINDITSFKITNPNKRLYCCLLSINLLHPNLILLDMFNI